MGEIQNGAMYIMYRVSSTTTTAEPCKMLAEKNHFYSIAKTTPRVRLTFLKVEKIEHDNLVVSFLFFLISSSHATQNYKKYMNVLDIAHKYSTFREVLLVF